MSRSASIVVTLFIFLLVLTSPRIHAIEKVNQLVLNLQLKEYAIKTHPDLAPGVRFEIKEYTIPGMWEALGIQLFFAEYIDSKLPFNQLLFLYRNGTITPFAEALGGHGLMSAVMFNNQLFFTYSWGSGVHRSHIGRLSIVNDRVVIVESNGFTDIDVFVKKINNRIEAETGAFYEFNMWGSLQQLGLVTDQCPTLLVQVAHKLCVQKK